MEMSHYEKEVSLGQLLDGMVDDAALAEYSEVTVNGLVHDSRKAKPGNMFIAYAGFSMHGMQYAQDAIDRGASVVVWDSDCEDADAMLDELADRAMFIRCDNLRARAGEIASRYYGNPSAELDMIGVTGTDGKTSIAHFIAQCLDQPGQRCGIMGTLGNGFLDDMRRTGLTTADAIDVHRGLAAIRDQEGVHAVMEVSSHGIDQGRINAVHFDTAVFSNFSQDHLDYHETLEKYAEAKSKLFTVPGLRVAVINLDDAFGLELAEKCRKYLCVWGYTMQADASEVQAYADFVVQARSIEPVKNGFSLKVKTPKGVGGFNVGLMGSFNVSNVLATLTTLLVSGVSFDEAVARLGRLHAVTGRMEVTAVSGKPVVIIDYAHTPKGLESACRAVKEHYPGKLWCVFGCGGDRDVGKRPLMAAVAERYADRVVVTSDNPRHEQPQNIIDDIMHGFSKRDSVDIIIDRKQAIAHAIEQAGENDVVLLAGKGHECTQIIGDTHIAFDDHIVARDSLGVAG